jgi:hypothetical protein
METEYTKGFRAGMSFELERVIKLLENDYWHHLSYLPRLIEDKATLVHDKECIGCQLLTFIKGEN